MKRLVHKLIHAHVTVIAALFAFWVLQFCGWMMMMMYVQFVNPKLGESVLYVTQISHWALVEAAATAALSSWALLQAKHNGRHHDHHEHLPPES